MFYVVDVETNTAQPTVGGLLTVGVAMVEKDQIVDTLYLRVAYSMDASNESTMAFWEEQDAEVYEEAFSWKVPRLHPISAAAMINEFVTQHSEKKDSFFVANPASFDYPWIELLFRTCGQEVPFSHRTLCLRSMRFGIEGGEYGEKRPASFTPEKPHHALYDAVAEANDLIELIGIANAG